MSAVRSCITCGSPFSISSGVECLACQFERAKRGTNGRVDVQRVRKLARLLKEATARETQKRSATAKLTRAATSKVPNLHRLSPCVVCGTKVEIVRMEVHLRDEHGLDQYGAPLSSPEPHGPWVHVVSGGLPSLGKRR